MEPKIQASATVLTYNSEKTLRATLESLRDFDEILVLDGGSTDGTLDLAREFGARVEAQSEMSGPIKDFTQVRIRSFALAKYDWIVWVDSDESINQELAQSIREAVVKGNVERAYRINYTPIVRGKPVHYASFSPLRYVRLVNRKTAHWLEKKKVHEKIVFEPSVKIETLRGEMFSPWSSIETYIRKDKYYIALAFSRVPEKRGWFLGLKSVLKNLVLAGLGLVKWVYFALIFGRTGEVLPWDYQWRFLRYFLLIVRERLRQLYYGRAYQPPTN